MALNFNKYVADGKQFVKEVAIELNSPEDIQQAGSVVRAVLHAFRKRVPVQESIQLLAQLPMLIKAVYVDGWQLKDESRTLRHIGDFIEAVREAGGKGTISYFTTDYEVQEAIRAVFKVLKRYVSEGEIQDVLSTLPAELQPLLAEA